MTDTLCCRYNGKDVIAHFTDTPNEIMIGKEIVKLDDPLLTKVFTTKFLFTLKPQLKDETMPNFWKLTPAILNMDKSRINLIWQKDTAPNEVADNVGMLSINFNDLNITRQIINYIKLDQHFYLDNGNQPDPKEDYINLSLVDWFAEYFKWQYLKTNDKTAYLYMQCLKKQFADNPVYTTEMLLAPLHEMTDELKREFADDQETKYNLNYLVGFTAKDMNIFNEFKYFAHTGQYVPENYAYNFMSITAYKIANAFGIKPYNAFTRLRYMVMGDSLKYLMQYLTAGDFDTLPNLRKLLSE